MSDTLDVPLSDASDVWFGEQAHDNAAEMLRAVGDVDGDLKPDFVVGVRGHDSSLGGENVGAAVLFYGDAVTSGSPDLSAAAVWSGQDASGQFGYAVAAAGDVNGDGFDDFLAAAPDALESRGRVWMVYGRAARYAGRAPINRARFPSWVGSDVGDRAGDGLAPAGDVNGDGFDDFLIGSPGADRGFMDDVGAVHLIYGSAAGSASPSELTADATFWGETADDEPGTRFSMSHGDIDGDGIEEVVMGAARWGDDDEGSVYVWTGADGPPAGNIELADAAVVIRGEATGGDSRFGYGLDADGDVDGDGYDDLAVGAFLYDEPAVDAGRGYLFYGSSSPDTTVVAASADAIFASLDGADRLGREVCIEGDLDGDGRDDLVMGMYRWNGTGRIHAGAVVVYLGNEHREGTYELDEADVMITSATEWSMLGYSLHAGGDFDADGLDDLLIGAPGVATSRGAAFLFTASSF